MFQLVAKWRSFKELCVVVQVWQPVYTRLEVDATVPFMPEQ